MKILSLNPLSSELAAEQKAQEIFNIADAYKTIQYKLHHMNKAMHVTKEHKHISGKIVKSTAVVKARYDLDAKCAYAFSAVIGQLMGPLKNDLEKDWLKLSPQSSRVYYPCQLKYFLDLPDWDDSLSKLNCEIIN